MSLILEKQSRSQSDGKYPITVSKEETEARHLLNDLFEHNEDRGALSTLTLGAPGSCKTAFDCACVDYAIENYPKDKIFWRSSMGSKLQFFKVSKWHIWIEKNSGVHIFNRKTQKDASPYFQKRRKLSYFKNFDDLYRRAHPGVCNAVFFKDLHLKDVDEDRGTLQWFGFFRYLLHFDQWTHVIFDEYHEMVKSGSSSTLWRYIKNHSSDVSNARKNNVVMHGNAHQVNEIDYRILDNIMTIVQMYGSRPYGGNMVTKHALGHLPKPTERTGAVGWVSTGGKFGKFRVSTIYKLRSGMSYEARIISSEEHTKICDNCHRVYLQTSLHQRFCTPVCYDEYTHKHNNTKNSNNAQPSISHNHSPAHA